MPSAFLEPVHSNQHTTSQSLNLTLLDLFSDQAWAEWERRYVAGYSKPCMIQTRYRRLTTFFHSWYAKVLTSTTTHIFIPHNSPNCFASRKVCCILLSAAGLMFKSVNDNDELLSRARMLLVRMCGVTPPRPLIGPILKVIFDTILNSPVRRLPVILLNSCLL